jgi:hypothetical protein
VKFRLIVYMASSSPRLRLAQLQAGVRQQLSEYRYDAFFGEGTRFGGSRTTWCPLSGCRAFALSAIRFKSSSLDRAIAARIDRSSSKIGSGAIMASTP